MPFNGAGVFTAPGADFPAVTQTVISSTHYNNVINDIATGLSLCLTKDGQQTVTGNIPFGGFRATNIGITGIAGSVGTPAINVSDAGTGLYRSAASELAVTVAGTQVARFASTGLIVMGAASVSTTLTATTSVVTPLVQSSGAVDLVFGANGGTDWNIASTGKHWLPGVDNTQNIGSATKRVNILSASVINETQGADIASAGTIDLEAATGDYVNITGTTTITAITLSQGHQRKVKFAGALTLTNGASLILPGGVNILTSAGEVAEFVGEAAGVVRLTLYTRGTASIDVQVFTAGGTWTKPAGAKTVFVMCVGAGGGGGGGVGGSAGTVRQGGTGGGGGSCVSGTFNAADLGATETVTVGAAGTSGAAASDGGIGGNSSLGTKLVAYGGGGGNGTGGGSNRTGGAGAGTAGAGVVGGTANVTGGLPALTSNTVGVSGQGAGAGLAQAGKPAEYGGGSGGGEDSTGTSAGAGGGSMWGGSAGGCGGSVSSANVELGGAAAGAAGTYVVGTGVAGGAVNGGAGNAGANGAALVMGGGGSGGGGQDAGTGGVGGAGGALGGGGGGGGGGTTTGGAGGVGGRGEVRVYTYS